MKLTNHQIDDVLLLRIKEKDANLSVAELFKELVFREIARGDNKLIISFEEVEYVDSSFLGALVAILKKLMSVEGKLVIISLNEDIKHLFTLTRLDKVFILEDDLESAKTHF